MRPGLEHLPPTKRRELERVVEILFAEFQDAIVLGTQAHKRMGKIQSGDTIRIPSRRLTRIGRPGNARWPIKYSVPGYRAVHRTVQRVK